MSDLDLSRTQYPLTPLTHTTTTIPSPPPGLHDLRGETIWYPNAVVAVAECEGALCMFKHSRQINGVELEEVGSCLGLVESTSGVLRSLLRTSACEHP